MGKQCKIADFNTYREIPDTGFKHPEVDSIRCSNRSIRSIRSIRIGSLGFDRSIDARARDRGDARRRTRARVAGANVSGESNARRRARSRDAR